MELIAFLISDRNSFCSKRAKLPFGHYFILVSTGVLVRTAVSFEWKAKINLSELSFKWLGVRAVEREWAIVTATANTLSCIVEHNDDHIHWNRKLNLLQVQICAQMLHIINAIKQTIRRKIKKSRRRNKTVLWRSKLVQATVNKLFRSYDPFLYWKHHYVPFGVFSTIRWQLRCGSIVSHNLSLAKRKQREENDPPT